MKFVDDDDTNSDWSPLNGTKRFGKETGELEMKGRIKTIQNIALSKSVRAVGRVVET